MREPILSFVVGAVFGFLLGTCCIAVAYSMAGFSASMSFLT